MCGKLSKSVVLLTEMLNYCLGSEAVVLRCRIAIVTVLQPNIACNKILTMSEI